MAKRAAKNFGVGVIRSLKGASTAEMAKTKSYAARSLNYARSQFARQSGGLSGAVGTTLGTGARKTGAMAKRGLMGTPGSRTALGNAVANNPDRATRVAAGAAGVGGAARTGARGVRRAIGSIGGGGGGRADYRGAR